MDGVYTVNIFIHSSSGYIPAKETKKGGEIERTKVKRKEKTITGANISSFKKTLKS